MLDADSHMWSMRRSKANFFRVMALLTGTIGMGGWFGDVRHWKNPITTVLVHVLFLILVWYPQLIGLWNYRFRPRHPPHMDTRLSWADGVHPDELDEEFDTFPPSKPQDVVRMRYDRLRSVARRIQTVFGDMATHGERLQLLLSWRDPRATALFVVLCLCAAVVRYVTPFRVVALLAGLFLLRHPRFRSKLAPLRAQQLLQEAAFQNRQHSLISSTDPSIDRAGCSCCRPGPPCSSPPSPPARATAPCTGRSWIRSHGGAGGRTGRSGGAPRRPTRTPSTASGTCTAAGTVQESLWKRRRQPCPSHRPRRPPPPLRP